jgi:hypothetical protein
MQSDSAEIFVIPDIHEVFDGAEPPAKVHTVASAGGGKR